MIILVAKPSCIRVLMHVKQFLLYMILTAVYLLTVIAVFFISLTLHSGKTLLTAHCVSLHLSKPVAVTVFIHISTLQTPHACDFYIAFYI